MNRIIFGETILNFNCNRSMSIPNLTFAYIKPDSSTFQRVLDFRYKNFFEPFKLGRGIVEDELDPISIHIAATTNGEIVGYVRVTLGSQDAQLSQMAVEISARKKGLGKELLDKALERVKEAGIKRVSLNSRLNGLKFYQKMGFKSVGEVFSSKKSGLLHMRMEKILD
jgi:predicted GNAT family N-acyltransferase